MLPFQTATDHADVRCCCVEHQCKIFELHSLRSQQAHLSDLGFGELGTAGVFATSGDGTHDLSSGLAAGVSLLAHRVSDVRRAWCKVQMSPARVDDPIHLIGALLIVPGAQAHVARVADILAFRRDDATGGDPGRDVSANGTTVDVDPSVAVADVRAVPRPAYGRAVRLCQMRIDPLLKRTRCGAAPTGRGSIRLHRDVSLTRNRGATPGAVTSSDRASSCPDFTTPHQIGRAA